jgi:hypothetical protein
MSSLSIYNTFNISPGKQAYLCSINDLWASRLEFLARTNYLPLNERFFSINLCESFKCNICDDDIVKDLHHFLFECKTLRGIRQELFEEIETVIQSFYPDLSFSELPPFQKLQFLIGDFCLSFNTELGFSLDQFSKKLLCTMMKQRAILIWVMCRWSGTCLILYFFYFICHSYILLIIKQVWTQNVLSKIKCGCQYFILLTLKKKSWTQGSWIFLIKK